MSALIIFSDILLLPSIQCQFYSCTMTTILCVFQVHSVYLIVAVCSICNSSKLA